MTWVDNIEKQWRDSNYNMRSISPDHDVGQCIRGFKLLANIPWDSVDDVIIPVNVSESFHWLLVVFRIKLRCLHLYDSMSEGYVHTKKVNKAVVIVVCIHVYLLNTSIMVFLIFVLLILMQSTIVKGMPQSYDIMEKQNMRMARLVRMKKLVQLLANLMDLA
ncbi:hypothetical protein MTR67_032593 [Solanum verrucosum]|uniref:Ubiquitin-like protease family profile domain-containing protein n=1 Tax=Solanum verrucosum TaxID=315347 RepID=A0AAF0U4P3_SOLVR|nr:hypothetical protein MTR67_032593 [Solanum verrucosum]